MKTIKLLALLFCTTLCLGLVSCSDDDDEAGSSKDLVGTWELVSSQGWEKEDGEIVDRWNDEGGDFRITFYEDGTCESAEYYSGSWHYESEGEWEYRGGKIYLYDEYGEEEDVVTVKSLTSSRIEIEWMETENYSGSFYEYYEIEVFRKIND